MYRKVVENPYSRISIRRLKSKKRAKILGSRFAEAVPPAESLKAKRKHEERFGIRIKPKQKKGADDDESSDEEEERGFES